jgi:hypothetical protein
LINSCHVISLTMISNLKTFFLAMMEKLKYATTAQ